MAKIAFYFSLLDDKVIVWLIGNNETWTVPVEEVEELNETETGDKYENKICNVCHRLLPVKKFAKNQNNRHGILRRPSCIQCRTDIDKRAPKSSQAKEWKKLVQPKEIHLNVQYDVKNDPLRE